ncbi:MAG: efflux transporter outer membrane subunit [bacterium]|nr:efflux transporter outer membrane subunit [bacterium]
MTCRHDLPPATSVHKSTSAPGAAGCVAAATALVALALVGCQATSPPPAQVDLEIDVPPEYSTTPIGADPAAESATLADGWWREFGDPMLDSIIERALTDNRDLRAAAARVEAAAASRTIAGAGALPTVDFGTDANRARRIFVGFPFGGGGVPSATATTYGLSLNLRWELDVWGRVAAAESAAIADLEAAAVDEQAARLSLVGQVCKAYFAAIEARQQLALARATATAFRATADDVGDRYRRGVRPATDVWLATTNLSTAEASIARRERQLQVAIRQLEVLAGSYPAGRAAIAGDLPAAMPAIPAALPGELLQRRPDLAAAERRLAAAGCRVDAARAALYPRLSLTASGGTTSDDLEDLIDHDFRVWSVGANLLQPLFQGGALQADVRRGEALAAEAVASYGSTVLRAFAEVENALAAESLLAREATSTTTAAERSRATYELARERWQLGLADFLLVADGQRQSFQAESQRLLVTRQRLDNRIDLVLALGGGYGAEDAKDSANENVIADDPASDERP